MKIIIVGGVAGGASAATRARRNSESAKIVMFEKGDYVSFANCGLPYHIGKVIEERDNLLIITPEGLKKRANIDVRIKTEVLSVDTAKKTVTAKNSSNNEIYEESYDKLILSPGSIPILPPIEGANHPDIDILWTLPDMDKIIDKIQKGAKSAVVVGAGFIGIELAENLSSLGLKTTIIEKVDQVLPQIDREMSVILEKELLAKEIILKLGASCNKVEKIGSRFLIFLDNGDTIESDILVFSIGVKPNTKFLKNSGIALNQRGAVIVDKYLETNFANIYAIGDAVEINEFITNERISIPLAGPANKQGRIAADNIFEKKTDYKGSLGTSICKVFNKTTALVGLTERKLINSKIEHRKYYVLPASNASYYPGAETMIIKTLINNDGKLLGAQIVGGEGVDKRIDLLASAIRNNLSLEDLSELELAYAPPYSSAKDPVNFVGFVGMNILSKMSEIVNADNIPANATIVDVREDDEFKTGAIPNAVNIPLGELRHRLSELPKDKLIVVNCKAGLRGYLAERILKENAFNVRNLSGGYEVWKLYHSTPSRIENTPANKILQKGIASNTMNIDNKIINLTKEINACNLQCPGPILKVKKSLADLKNGEMLKVTANDMGFYNDIKAWCQSTGNTLCKLEQNQKSIEAYIQKGTLTKELPTTENQQKEKQTTIVLFSNDLDKALASMIIATGFASLGHNVSIFFTFWGLNVLRREEHVKIKKDFLSKMFGFMMPRGAKKLALSKMHMLGMGTAMMRHIMKSKNVNSLPEMIVQAQSMGVKFLACDMAMNVMGIKKEELLDGVEEAGVATFASLSEKSFTTLFI